MLPLAEVQAAFVDALTPALAPVPVIDQAGPNQAFPYVTVGEFIAGETDPLGETEEAVNMEVTIHVWSRQLGMQQCQILMRQAKDALNRKRLQAAGFEWVDTIWIYATTLREPDGVTRHGILRFRVLTFSG